MSYLDRLRLAYDILFCNNCIENLRQANENVKFLQVENDRLRKENWKLRCLLDTAPSAPGEYDGEYGSEYCDFIDSAEL